MRKLLIFSVLAVCISCADDSGVGKKPVDSNVIIETREVLGENSRTLTFYARTKKIYTCSNYPIATEQHGDHDSFDITFTGIPAIGICLTSLGPATATVDLQTVPSGDYAISFNNGNLRNRGTLLITDTEISLNFAGTNGIEIVRPVTKRVPPKTYWATFGYHVSSSSALVDEFVQKLVDKGAVFNKQAPGHYFYYEIDDNGDMVIDAKNSGYWFLKGFVFQFDGDESVLRDLVKVEGKNFKEDMNISLNSYRGEFIYNWGN